MTNKFLPLLVAGALTLGGCSSDSPYSFEGKIDGERIECGGDFDAFENKYSIDLKIIRMDSTKVRYYLEYRSQDKLDLSLVDITRNGETKRYKRNLIGGDVLDSAQIQAEEYLEKIIDYKKQEGMRGIRK